MDNAFQSPPPVVPVEQTPRRRWPWYILMALVVLPLCVCCGGPAVLVSTIFGSLKASDAYQNALAEVRQDPRVIERLGEPIKEVSWFPQGSINLNNADGNADLRFSVQGPKGTADVQTRARKTNGTWTTDVLNLRFADGQSVDLAADPIIELE